MEDAAFADIRFVQDAPREYFGHLKECKLAQRSVAQLDAGLLLGLTLPIEVPIVPLRRHGGNWSAHGDDRLAQSVRDRFGRCVHARHHFLVEAYH